MRYKLLLLGIAVASVAIVVGGVAASPGTTARVSVDSAGSQGDSWSLNAAISADGRYVAFYSYASNLVPGDTNGKTDVFVHDRQTEQTERVSVDDAGNQGNYHSSVPAISADGRYVAFQSGASNLVSGDANNYCDTDGDSLYDDNCFDVFVRDRDTDEDGIFDEPGAIGTTLVSVDSSGNQGNASSLHPAISADGRHVAFESNASNLVYGDTNGGYDVFVHDRVTGETVRASATNAGGEADNWSYAAALSADGRFVAFESYASNLVSGDSNGWWDVFVHDRDTNEDGIFDEPGATSTTRVSVSSSGLQGDSDSMDSAISGDGRFVVFDSSAMNLVPGDTEFDYDIFVHDRDTDEDGLFDEPGAISTTLVSVDSSGNQGNDWSMWPDISADGRYVAFQSDASNLVLGDTNTIQDVFVHDRETGQTARVSVDSDGNQADNDSYYPSLSADGRFVAFESNASNLVYGDTNGGRDVFIHESSLCVDCDEDSIADEWETNGLDVNGDTVIDLDLPSMGADPAKKDIFIEADYMQGHEPDANALQDVVEAFANRNMTLHITLDEQLPEIEPILFLSRGPDAADDFDDLKSGNPENPCGTGATDGHFGTAAERSDPNCTNILAAKRVVFRYAIFGHDHAHSIGSSGIAELPGNDFMITLGGWSSEDITAVGGKRAAEAGTFMHELGHTLGLGHGGGDHINCKPNYLSIMTYSLQFSILDPTRPLDYSNEVLASLDEANLSEPAGIGGPVGRQTVYGTDNGVWPRTVPASGPIDWNNDRDATDTAVSSDVSRIDFFGCGDDDGDTVQDGLTTLSGFNDWTNLVFNFRSATDFADGVHTTPHEIPDVTSEQALDAAESVDFDVDGITNYPDNCPSVYNPDQADRNADGIGNACAPMIRGDGNGDEQVSMVDAMLIAQCVAGLIDCGTINQTAADVNCSGSVSMVDAMLVAQKVAGLISDFPVCGL